MKAEQQAVTGDQEFHFRLDFYWQALAMYAGALILYALARGSVESKQLTLALDDPVVILLAIIIILAVLTLLYNGYLQRSIIVGHDFIRFKNRFRERTLTPADIKHISIGREKLIKVRGTFKVIKIRINQRRRPLRVRPSLYDDDAGLYKAIVQFKKRREQ